MPDDAELRDLIEAAAGGDRSAFEKLVLSRRERVVRTAFQITGDPEDAKDVAQGVFLRLWKVLRRFDPGKRFDTWMYRITVNAAIDHLRERGPRGVLQPLPDDPGVLAAEPLDQDAALDTGALQRAFLSLAGDLPPRQRAIFVMREIEGVDTPTIARALGVTESTVRNHLFQARKTLREGLERNYPGLVPRSGRPGQRDRR